MSHFSSHFFIRVFNYSLSQSSFHSFTCIYIFYSSCSFIAPTFSVIFTLFIRTYVSYFSIRSLFSFSHSSIHIYVSLFLIYSYLHFLSFSFSLFILIFSLLHFYLHVYLLHSLPSLIFFLSRSIHIYSHLSLIFVSTIFSLSRFSYSYLPSTSRSSWTSPLEAEIYKRERAFQGRARSRMGTI